MQLLDFRCLPLALHVYRLHEDGPVAEELEEGEETACSSWTLPAGIVDGARGQRLQEYLNMLFCIFVCS